MPIITLQWNNNVAYGPRGTRYEIQEVAGQYEVRGYSPENPAGWLIDRTSTLEEAMTEAQHDCESLTEAVGNESNAIAAAGRTQLQR